MPAGLTRRAFLSSLALPALAAPDLANDPDRPRFHFLPPSNWMNDPNAPVWFNGNYHLFYQYNPKAAKWDTMNWGHAVSADLLHWKHLPIALSPTPGGPDKDGCFTGCMVIDKGKPVIVYTGVRPEVQCLATSDDLITWRKQPTTPVIAAPPPGIDTPGFRDPHVWRDNNEWLMLIGAGFRGVGGTALLYKSANLREWTYLKPLLTGKIDAAAKGTDVVSRGEMWECPEFFPVGKKWLFHVSTQGKVLYWLGTWKDRTFTPEANGVLVHGAGYAPKSCDAPGKRRILWSWLREQRDGERQLAAGWSGSMSLAVVPGLARDGSLLIAPAAEYRKLRGKRQKDSIPEDCCEIRAVIDGTKPLALSRGGRELVSYDPDSRMLSAGHSEAQAPAGPIELRIFLDGSVVEVFANSSIWLTGRVYGPLQGVSMAGAAQSLEAWPLKPISPDRLTS